MREADQHNLKFLVKWKDYGEEENSWEPIGELFDNNKELITQFYATHPRASWPIDPDVLHNSISGTSLISQNFWHLDLLTLGSDQDAHPWKGGLCHVLTAAIFFTESCLSPTDPFRILTFSFLNWSMFVTSLPHYQTPVPLSHAWSFPMHHHSLITCFPCLLIMFPLLL